MEDKDKIHNRLKNIALEAGDKERAEKKAQDIDDKPAKEVHHFEELNKMLKIIEIAPIDEWEKNVLRIRLTHDYTTSTQILMSLAQKHCMRFNVILEIERQGLEGVKDYLAKASLDDAIGKFNEDSQNVKNLKQQIDSSGLFNEVDEGGSNDSTD